MSDDDAHLAIVNAPQMALNKEFYDNIIAQKATRKPVYKEFLQPHTGDAFLVKAGQVIRAEQVGVMAQILDWFMISPDLTEYLNYGHSAPLEGPYLSTYTRCWSNSGVMGRSWREKPVSPAVAWGRMRITSMRVMGRRVSEGW